MSKDTTFKLQISIRRAEDDKPVFQKRDGERFDNPITVKLNVATKYNLLFTTRPAMGIKKVLLMGEELCLELQKREKPDNQVCVYHVDWTTDGFEVSKGNNPRSVIPFMIEMENGSTISPAIQTKVYPQTEMSHSTWGQEFHLLDIQCHRKGGSNHLDVQEQYI